jgi:hypothetical protein
MTIRRFAEWGKLIPQPKVIEICNSDTQIAKVATKFRSSGSQIPHVFAAAGSLAISLGNALTMPNSEVRELPIDLLHISYSTDDGAQRNSIAANSVLMRNRLWTGQIVAVTNSGYLGNWEIAPRAHPNDGVFDVVEVNADMSWRQRLIARHRLPRGTHMPHPSVGIRQCNSESWIFAKPIGLYLDDEFVERTMHVDVTIEPGALNLVI